MFLCSSLTPKFSKNTILFHTSAQQFCCKIYNMMKSKLNNNIKAFYFLRESRCLPLSSSTLCTLCQGEMSQWHLFESCEVIKTAIIDFNISNNDVVLDFAIWKCYNFIMNKNIYFTNIMIKNLICSTFENECRFNLHI